MAEAKSKGSPHATLPHVLFRPCGTSPCGHVVSTGCGPDEQGGVPAARHERQCSRTTLADRHADAISYERSRCADGNSRALTNNAPCPIANTYQRAAISDADYGTGANRDHEPQVRSVVSDGVYPPAASGSELRRYYLSEFPGVAARSA